VRHFACLPYRGMVSRFLASSNDREGSWEKRNQGCGHPRGKNVIDSPVC
jgi:hypothetical protein